LVLKWVSAREKMSSKVVEGEVVSRGEWYRERYR